VRFRLAAEAAFLTFFRAAFPCFVEAILSTLHSSGEKPNIRFPRLPCTRL
jgi:hypothetical protein